MAYKITFVGDEWARRQGLKQVHYAPWGRLERDQSIVLAAIPESCKGTKKHQFLVDGKPYVAPKPEKPKPAEPKKG